MLMGTKSAYWHFFVYLYLLCQFKSVILHIVQIYSLYGK